MSVIVHIPDDMLGWIAELDLPLCYFSGVMAAGSPCVIVLIPLILRRFQGRVDHHLVLFSLGFIICYVLISFTANTVLTSSIQNGFKMGLGSIFAVTGILTTTGGISTFQMPIMHNEFFIGSVFAMLVSVNPW